MKVPLDGAVESLNAEELRAPNELKVYHVHSLLHLCNIYKGMAFIH